jgi:hypothetical protein
MPDKLNYSDYQSRKDPGIVKRALKPTPRFFRKIRRIGIGLLTVAGAIAAAPVALPALVVTAAGYLATAGAVSVAVSQLTVEPE